MAIDLNRALEIARGELGYRESGTNDTKYNRWLGPISGYPHSGYGYPWCASWTSWVLSRAGGTAGDDYPRTASCLAIVSWGRSRGRFHNSPRVGDLVLFGPGGGTHVELVVGVSGSTITCIGGNTSGGWGGNYWNGDGVYKKSRAASEAYGYVRPVYGNSSNNTEGDEMPTTTWYGAGEGQILKPGEWTTIEFTNRKGGKDGGSYWSVVTGESTYMLTAHVTVDGSELPAGTEVQMRAATYREVGGLSLPTGVLKRGARGDSVRRVQRGLVTLGYSVGSAGADGDYGPATERAVRELQRDAGITVDGEYGPATRAAMLKKAPPTRWTKVTDHPISGTVHQGGDCHASYALTDVVGTGRRIRVRIVQHGDTPVRILRAKATVTKWT